MRKFSGDIFTIASAKVPAVMAREHIISGRSALAARGHNRQAGKVFRWINKSCERSLRW